MQHQGTNRYSKTFITGIVLCLAGTVLLLSRLTNAIPVWLTGWPMALIAAGVLIIVYTGARSMIWLWPVAWGVFLMIDEQAPQLKLHNYVGPVSIIMLGIAFIMLRYQASKIKLVKQQEGLLHVLSCFSHNKNSFNMDSYKGVDIVCLAGNNELAFKNNFAEDGAEVKVTVFMGAVKLAIPPNWAIKNDLTSILADVADKRQPAQAFTGVSKTVTLKGNITLGSVELVDRL